MAKNLYIEVNQLKLSAEGEEADVTDVWELLAEGVSRLFDRQCEVSDGFFSPATEDVTTRSYRGNGTRFLQLFPYIADSIIIIDIGGTNYVDAAPDYRRYREENGYLVFNYDLWPGLIVDVTARYGFEAVPSDIQLAGIEQALAMWRRKDMSFAEISGVSAAAVNAELSPSFSAVTKRYREIYSGNQFFA